MTDDLDRFAEYVRKVQKALPASKFDNGVPAIPAQQGRPKEVVALEYGRCALRTFTYNLDYENFGSVSAYGNHWARGSCTARCLAGSVSYYPFISPQRDHDAPNEHCSCGVYGTLTLEHLVGQYPHEATAVVAVIAAEGQTIIGDLGLQTARATVVAYWLAHQTPPWTWLEYRALDIPHQYDGLPVVAARQFKDGRHFLRMEDMLREYGFPIPKPEFLQGFGFAPPSNTFIDRIFGGPMFG
jgi:hypothetical protein